MVNSLRYSNCCAPLSIPMYANACVISIPHNHTSTKHSIIFVCNTLASILNKQKAIFGSCFGSHFSLVRLLFLCFTRCEPTPTRSLRTFIIRVCARVIRNRWIVQIMTQNEQQHYLVTICAQIHRRQSLCTHRHTRSLPLSGFRMYLKFHLHRFINA